MYNVPLNETSVRDIRSLCRFGPSFSPSALTLSVLGMSLFGALTMAFRGGDSFCLGGNVNLAWTTFPSICACMKKIRNIDFPTWFVFIIAHNSTPTLHSILWFYKPTPPPPPKRKKPTPSMNSCAFSASTLVLNSTYPYPLGILTCKHETSFKSLYPARWSQDHDMTSIMNLQHDPLLAPHLQLHHSYLQSTIHRQEY